MPRCDLGHILCGSPSCTAPNKCHYCANGQTGTPFVEGMCRNCWAVEPCGCDACSACETLFEVENLCKTCVYCLKCCKCPRCASCNATGSICDDCSKCNSCCKCRRVVFMNRDLDFKDSKTFKKNSSRRKISVELEIAGCRDFRPIQKVCQKWSVSVVRDASLQGNNPFELNTSPANGDVFIEQIEEIADALRMGGATVDDSCGLHVHIDARDYQFWEIEKLIRLYAAIEPTLFLMVKENRRKNNYCIKCGDILLKALNENMKDNQIHSAEGVLRGVDIKNVISETIYKAPKKKFQEMRVSKYASDTNPNPRYNALNIHSWVYRGSIESRLHEGTMNPVDITNWGMLWANIIDYIAKTNFKKLPKDGRQVLHSICKSYQLASWVSSRYNGE